MRSLTLNPIQYEPFSWMVTTEPWSGDGGGMTTVEVVVDGWWPKFDRRQRQKLLEREDGWITLRVSMTFGARYGRHLRRDTIQLETVVSTISQEYLLEFISEYGISEDVHPEFPGPEDRIVDFLKGKVGVYSKFFEFANFRIPLSQFPLIKFTCHNYLWRKEYFPLTWTGAHMLRRMRCNQPTPTLDMDLFNLISPPNPSKVKTGLFPRVAHEVPLLTATASRVIDMDDPDAATESSGTPSTVKKSPLDFDNENPASSMTEGKGPKDQAQETVAPEIPLGNMPAVGATSKIREDKVVALEPRVSKKRGRRGNDGADANAPPKVLRKDYASVRPKQSTRRGKSLSMIGLAVGATFVAPADTKGVNDPDPLSYEIPTENVATMEVQDTRYAKSAGSSKSTSSPSMVGSPREIYQPGWGVTNSYRLDTPDACQDVDMGSQLRLRFEQEVRLLKKAIAQISRWDQRIQIREEEIKKFDQEIQGLQNQTGDLKTFLEAETDMKKAAETKNVDLTKELELIASHRWVIGHGLCLAVMKYGESTELRQVFADVVSAGIAKGMSEGLKYEVEHRKDNLDLEAVEAYDPEAETKYVAALNALRDLKYPMVDQLEILKDALIDVVRDPKDTWAFKEEILLADAIVANVSRAEKKKKCRVVCHTHGVDSVHHARSDGVPVSVPTVAPQVLLSCWWTLLHKQRHSRMGPLQEFTLVVSHVLHGSLLVCT
uniref:Transposase (Putative), gypsy type n=1 Tax=Tanacetum cinerariifolium TaxID=118510 RepID=A0A699HBD5_TANCI|nr:hypothetical protein [Tanacetum cinerariifolium]